MNVFQAVLLGVLQGLTEWLPVSSSGHLVMAQHFLNLPQNVFFNVTLHLGTLVVVITLYREKIFRITKAFFTTGLKSRGGRFFFYVMLASSITGFFGLVFKDFFESLFTPRVVGVGLLLTSALLFLSDRVEGKGGMGARSASLTGLAQSLAIIPGVSRSGMTITTALLSGVEREEAVLFSFLISIPAIIGASLVEFSWTVFEPAPFLAGFLSAAVAGYAGIKLLVRTVMSKDLKYFSLYCLFLGALIFLV